MRPTPTTPSAATRVAAAVALVLAVGVLRPPAADGGPRPGPALPGPPMRLAFDDEFGEARLSPAWRTCWAFSPRGCSNGNQEGEWYTPSNVGLGGGALLLTARRQTVEARDMVTGAPRSYAYTSGMVTTQGRFSFGLGYVEWRVRIPKGQGFWPALWLMPADGTWPPELDVLEAVSNHTDVAYLTWHPAASSAAAAQSFPARSAVDLSAGYHTFGADRERDRITWYVDGRPVASTTDHVDSRRMYLVMNLAVGGQWPGYPDATTPFPSTFAIDYVRVWRR